MKMGVEDVVLIKGEEKNKGKWCTEIVVGLFKVKADVIHGVKPWTPKSHTER